MIDSFLSEVRALFQHGRNIDIRYFKSLSEIGEKMETFNYETISSVDQKLDTESDSLLSLTAKCHDGHQGKGTIQPGLRLVLSGNFFLALNRSHQFLFKKARI